MKAKSRRKQTVTELASDGRVTILGVSELQQELLTHWEQQTPVALTMSDDEAIDLAGAQLIIAAIRAAGRDRREFAIPDPLPSAVQEWTARAGLVFDPVVSEVHHE